MKAHEYQAKQLMAESSYPKGFDVVLCIGTGVGLGADWQSIGLQEQSDLAKIGIKVTLNKMVGSQLMPLYRAQKTDLFLGGWGPDYNDPHTNAQPFADYTAKQIAYRNAYENEQTAKMIQEAGVEMDDAKRIALYQAANKIIQDDGPFVFLYQPLYLHAVRNDNQGFLPGSTFALTKLYPVSRKK